MTDNGHPGVNDAPEATTPEGLAPDPDDAFVDDHEGVQPDPTDDDGSDPLDDDRLSDSLGDAP